MINLFAAYISGMLVQDYKPHFILKKGDAAPDFNSSLQDGSNIHLYDLKAPWIVLFFYPQDNTPTCTKEACNLRDNFSDLKKQGILLFGISPDSETKHKNFISKFTLPYNLIADKNHKIASSYGVWGKRKFIGLIFDGIHRCTFILDSNHRIHEIIYPVTSDRHHEQILKSIQQ